MSGRALRTGLLAGFLMNFFGWLGNQLVLGGLWSAAIAESPFAHARTRTIWHELGSLAPDFVYGIALTALYLVMANAWRPGRRTAYAAATGLWAVAIATPLLGTANSALIPWRLAALTVFLALLIMIPVSEVIWRRHPSAGSATT